MSRRFEKRMIILADIFEIMLDVTFKIWVIVACVKFVLYGVTLSFDGVDQVSTEQQVEKWTIRHRES